ncbi:hypothetical protein P3T73_06060 [Kiritimatiellota bacterium B12222]|nr:hypothetical protein P3T73_06060 [Kiritimatiellota bacterium B12222]
MKQSDQARAKRLLKLRTEGANFRWNYLLKSKQFWITIIAIVLMISYAITTPDDLILNRIIFCLMGVFIGRILRDMIWLKDIVDAFPFTEKIMNWEKIESIASDKTKAQPKDQPNPHTSGPVV